MYRGYNAATIMGDVINHLEAFSETDQFVFVAIGDLHYTSDGAALPVDVTTALELDDMSAEEDAATSVKQTYSERKIKAFKKMCRHVDRYLAFLYQYLNNHYSDDEISVSLFSDHGQGFMVEQDRYFFSRGRSNIAFMFRGGTEKYTDIHISDEIVSSLDYSKALRRLAGFEIKDDNTDGHLPKIFGGEGRDYAMAESMHPGDFYQAAIFFDTGVFFFINPSPVEEDGRFRLVDYECWIEGNSGTRTDNADEIEHFLHIIMRHIDKLIIRS
jgi:hypothetical protein